MSNPNKLVVSKKLKSQNKKIEIKIVFPLQNVWGLLGKSLRAWGCRKRADPV